MDRVLVCVNNKVLDSKSHSSRCFFGSLEEEVESVQITHKRRSGFHGNVACGACHHVAASLHI
jgi:hypothetical protein